MARNDRIMSFLASSVRVRAHHRAPRLRWACQGGEATETEIAVSCHTRRTPTNVTNDLRAMAPPDRPPVPSDDRTDRSVLGIRRPK